MPSYKQVFHMEPRITIAGGLNRHITRKEFVSEDGKNTVQTWVPKNADPAKTANNVELISRKYTDSAGKTYELTLQQAVDKRLREAGIKRRKGQASCLEIIFTGSHDRMVAMSRKELMKWSSDILKWAKKQWGEENVVSASLHVDERTPHIHMIVVPIVTGQSRRTKFHQEQKKSKRTYKINHNKLRLCKNEVYTKAKLYEYHDSLFQEVNKTYGLERGEFALPGSKKKHQDSIDYNRQLAEEAAERRSLLAEIQADYNEIQEDIQELQTKKDTLSSKVKEEQEKFDAAEAKTKEAEEEAEKAEERLASQKIIIAKNAGIINKQVSDFNARKEELEQTKTDIAANEETISVQNDDITANQQYLKELKSIKDEISKRKEELRSLSSLGLMKMIMELPMRILADIQERIKGYWKGIVTSYEEVKYSVGEGVEEDFAKINIKNNDNEYFIEVREKTGNVYLNGQEDPYRWSKSGEEMIMPELAEYFRSELTPEAKQYVESLYKKPTQIAETVWQSKQILGDAKIIKNAEKDYTLKTWDRDFKKWVKVADCVGFSVKSDSTYDYISVTLANGKTEHYNQFGSPLTEKQRRRQGLGTQNTGGGRSM